MKRQNYVQITLLLKELSCLPVNNRIQFKRLKITNKNPHISNKTINYVCVCLTVYNKAQAQIISNCEFKLWKFLQGTEYRVATLIELF